MFTSSRIAGTITGITLNPTVGSRNFTAWPTMMREKPRP